MKLKPLFKPLIKQKKKTVKSTKLPLKEQIEKFDCLPDNALEEEENEDISSCNKTFIED